MLNMSQKKLLTRMYLLHIEMLKTASQNPKYSHHSDFSACMGIGNENFIQRMHVSSKRDKIWKLFVDYKSKIMQKAYDYNRINEEIKCLFASEVLSKIEIYSIDVSKIFVNSNTSFKNTSWYDDTERSFNQLSQALEKMYNNLLKNYELIEDYSISLTSEDRDFFSEVKKYKI